MNRILLAATLTLAACSGEEADRTAAASEPPPAVTVVPVALRELAGGVTVSGTLVAREEAAIGAELSGYRVLRVLAEEGDVVRRGQPLAVLDGALLNAETLRLRAELAQAQVAAERARSEFARVADLKGQGVIADETIAQRGFEARSSATQIRAAEAALRDVATRRTRLTLRAPVDGTVLSRALRPGDVSGAGGSDPYFRIARDELIELEAEVPETLLGRVRPGQRVPVTLASGERFVGAVRLIGRRVETQTRLGRIRILLPRDPSQRLGGFANATIGEGGAPIATIPERALVYEGGPSVLALGRGKRVARVPVRTGARGGGFVELKQGPAVGTRVLIGASGLVLPGDQVSPKEAKAR